MIRIISNHLIILEGLITSQSSKRFIKFKIMLNKMVYEGIIRTGNFYHVTITINSSIPTPAMILKTVITGFRFI